MIPFKHSFEAASPCTESLAATTLVFMVQAEGLFTLLEFPYA